MKNEELKKVDCIMKKALASDMEPEDALNRSILNEWKESTVMYKKRKIPVIATAALCVLLTSATVVAAVRYLKPAEIAEKIGDETITSAFRGEDAIEINESQEAGDYRFTLLGVTKGDRLIQSALSEAMPNLQSTYAAVAIEHLDGTPMPGTAEDAYGQLEFFVSPLISGLNPNQYNIITMDGGYSDVVVDGVLYRIIECSDIEKFADRNLYLCISDSTFFPSGGYQFDEASGTISRSQDYEGINLLFDLPINPSKADPAAVEEYLNTLEGTSHNGAFGDAAEEATDQNGNDEAVRGEEDVMMFYSRLLEDACRAGNLEDTLTGEGFEALSVDTVTKKDGGYEYTYKPGEDSIPSNMFIGDDLITNGIDWTILGEGSGEAGTEIDTLRVIVLVENGDGTAAVTLYEKIID